MATPNFEIDSTEVESYDTLLEEIEKCFKKCHVILETRKEVLLQKVRQMKDLYQKHRDTVKAVEQIEKVRKATNEVITEMSLSGMCDKNFIGSIWDDEIRDLENDKLELEPFCELKLVPNLVELQHCVKTFHLCEYGAMELSKRREPCLMNRLVNMEDNVVGYGIAVGKENGLLYVADIGTNVVCMFSEEGQFIKHFGKGKLNRPYNLCLTKEFVFVTDKFSLVKFTKSGMFLHSYKSDYPRFIPYGICTAYQSLYICNVARNRVEVFNTDLEWVESFRKKLDRPTEINFYDNKLFVLSLTDKFIHVFDSDYEYVHYISFTGSETSQVLSYFTIDLDGDFIVSDREANCIKIYNSKGEYIDSLGNGYITLPRGVDTDSNNRIVLVSDSYNNLQKY